MMTKLTITIALLLLTGCTAAPKPTSTGVASPSPSSGFNPLAPVDKARSVTNDVMKKEFERERSDPEKSPAPASP